jgi:hypothetical protein
MTQAVNLANFANNLDSSGGVNPSALNAVVPISKGGTNASTAAGAATNLVVEIGKLLFPVGSIYVNAGVTTNPATLLGFGTWASFGAGRVPVGLNAGDPLFDALEETGGSKDAVVVSHTHSFSGTTGGVGNHNHAINRYTNNGAGQNGFGGGDNGVFAATNYTADAGAHNHSFSGTTAPTGSSATNANLQPYITVAMWKRTA